MSPFRALAMLGLLCVALATAARAQTIEEAGDPAGLFVDSIDVSVVNVDVYVTDRSGDRVTDLTRADFQVFEDGREIPISNFHVVESRMKARPLVVDPLAAREAPDSISVLPEHERLHMVVYVDNTNIEPFHRNNVFTHVRNFLGTSLTDGDLVSIFTYEKALHLRQPFTTSRGQVNDALREIEGLSAHGLSKETERRELLRDIDRASSRSAIEGRIRMYAEATANDLAFTVDSLKEIVDSLAGLPGRKVILHVSDGLPMRPAEDLYQAIAERFDDPSAVAEATTWDASRKFLALTARANANRVTFYTIEAAGLRSHGSGTADISAARSNISIDNFKRLNYQSPLQTMADETGGLAIVGTSNFRGAFERVASDLDTYYSLGYVAAHGGDGKYHDIKVKVRRKGLTVRTRKGYRAKTAATWMTEKTEAMLEYDLDTNPMAVTVALGVPTPAEGGEYLVPVLVSVPIENVVLIPQEELHRGSLALYLSAVDDRGRTAVVGDQPWVIEIPASDIERAAGMSLTREVSLRMRPGRQRIAIGLRDEIGGVASFVRDEIDVGRSG